MFLTTLFEHGVTVDVREASVLGITPALDEPIFKPLGVGGLVLPLPVVDMTFPRAWS